MKDPTTDLIFLRKTFLKPLSRVFFAKSSRRLKPVLACPDSCEWGGKVLRTFASTVTCANGKLFSQFRRCNANRPRSLNPEKDLPLKNTSKHATGSIELKLNLVARQGH